MGWGLVGEILEIKGWFETCRGAEAGGQLFVMDCWIVMVVIIVVKVVVVMAMMAGEWQSKILPLTNKSLG